MPLTIIRADLTRLDVDAIVNAANTQLREGGGVCGAIFSAAGRRELQKACDKLAPIQLGEAVITPGFRLPARFVIHAAGPVWHGGEQGEEQALAACYRNALMRATENSCESVAFPLISSGIFGYPKAEALRVATATIQGFLATHDDDLDVSLVVFDRAAFEISRTLRGKVEAFIDENYVDELKEVYRTSQLLQVETLALEKSRSAANIGRAMSMGTPIRGRAGGSLKDLLGDLDEPFSDTLLRLIDASGKQDPEIYKRANIDRKLFSKIRSNRDYRPSKRTALALAIALELSLEETGDLLRRAGYALSHSQKFDVIVEYFIISGTYNIFEINEVLFAYDQPLLGG